MGSNMNTRLQLMKKYNISFSGPIDSIRDPQWSSTHNTIFENIRQLGKTDFRQFRDRIKADSHHHPWRETLLQRAEKVAQRAKLCMEGRKNELGWRLSLEPIILEPFSVDVTCRHCRRRLWRSKVEIASNNLQDKGAINSLGSHLLKRQLCTCDKSKYVDNFLDFGINPLFDSRIDEAMEYAPDLQEDFPMPKERPDRVYGLRPTNRLQWLLDRVKDKFSFSAYDSPEGLRSSPFKKDERAAIHFPFLILEAKSEKGKSSFSDVQVQTAFGIRELLYIQDRLTQAAGEETPWDGGPLVWFLSNKGEQWKVYAAFIEKTGVTNFYRTVQLWNGGIDSPEHALQLLLIINYISDWACDIYCEGIARSLQKVSGNYSNAFADNTDIFSLSRRFQDRRVASENEEVNIEDSQSPSGDPLRAFDGTAGAFRDARFIQTKFIGLYIIKENFHHLINCTPSKQDSKRIAKSLLESLENSYRLRRDMLDELEISWTNQTREGLNTTPPSEIFIVAITALWYFTPNWEQTRELSYLAISESLIDDIIKVSDIDRPLHNKLFRIPLITSMPSFGDLLKRPTTDNLSACASRACIYTTHSPSSNTSFIWRSFSKEKPTWRWSQWRHWETVLSTGRRSKAREFVYDLYLKHRIRRCEPTSPIFRLSARLDELAPVEKLLSQPDRLAEDLWPWTGSFPGLKYDSLVFAVSEDNQHISGKPDLCVFVMDPSILRSGLSISKLQYGPSWHLQVREFDQKPGCNGKWNMTNIERNDKTIMENLRTLVERLKSTNYGQGSEGHLNLLSRAELNDESTSMKSQWEILTQGGVELQSLDKFEFDAGSPYRRQEWKEGSEIPLLRLQGVESTDGEPLCIVIDDDNDDDIQSNLPPPAGKLRLKVPPEISDPLVQDYKPAARSIGKTKLRTKLENRDARAARMPVSPTRKRVRELEQGCQEAESSAQAARRQRLTDGGFAQYFLSGDEHKVIP